MFKGGTFTLSEPICRCEYMNITWTVFTDTNGVINLKIGCNECNSQLTVPAPQFTMSFIFTKQYPKGEHPEYKRKSKNKDPHSNTEKDKNEYTAWNPRVTEIKG